MASRASGRSGVEDPALRLVDLLDVFGPAYVRRLDALARQDAASRVRIRALAALHRDGEQTLGALATALGVTPRRVTELVGALEADGLVTRRPHPTDGRSTLVRATGAGCGLVDRVWGQQRSAVAEVFRDLPRGDQAELLRILGTVTDALLRCAPPGSDGPACPVE